MKILHSRKLEDPQRLVPTDVVVVRCKGVAVLEHKMDKVMEIDKLVIFEVESGDFGNKDGIGGAFLGRIVE